MASSDLLIRISADGKQFFPTIERMAKETKLLTKSLGGLSALTQGIGGFVGVLGLNEANRKLDEMVDKADSIKDRANALNLTTDLVQRIENASGGDFEKSRSGLEKLAEAQQKVLSGEDKDFKISKQFAELGISLDDIKKKNFAQLFEQIADSMERAAISGQKIAALRDILGKSGGRLVEAFQKGLSGPEATNFILSPEEIERLASFKSAEQRSRLRSLVKQFATDQAQNFGGLKRNIAEGEQTPGTFLALGPVITGIIRAFRNALPGSTESDGTVKIPEGFEDRARDRAVTAVKQAQAEQELNEARKKEWEHLQKILDKEKEKEIKGSKDRFQTFSLNLARRPEADELTRIGLFRGGYDRTFSIQERQEKLLKEAVKQLQQLNKTVEEP